MNPLARGLAGLRIARNDDLVRERLDQDLILMALLVNVAYRILSKRAYPELQHSPAVIGAAR